MHEAFSGWSAGMLVQAARRRGGGIARIVLAGGLCLAFAFQKAAFSPTPVGHHTSDAAFYVQIAKNVALGKGLRTNVSLYDKGLKELPAPTSVYPLWPLVLGLASRSLGLVRAAWLLPEAFFLLSLLLSYTLANALGRSARGEILVSVRGVPVIDVGHAVMVILGSNAVFFGYTSTAWAEGLSMLLLLGALLPIAPAQRGDPRGWAALAGAIAGLAYLVRSQNAGALIAIASALAIVGIGRPRYRQAAVLALGSGLLVVAPWLVFLAKSFDYFTPQMLVDFAAYRETPALPPFSAYLEFPRLSDRVVDVLGGVAQSFHPLAAETYVASFGPIAYSVPVAALLFVVDGLRGRRPRTPLASTSLLPLTTALCAAGVLAPVYLMHMRFPFEWSFHWRHGLPLILAIALAIAWLGGRSAVWRAVLLLALATGLMFPRQDPKSFAGFIDVAGDVPVFRWIAGHEEPISVLSPSARWLAVWTRARGHWTRCDLPAQHVRLQLRHLDVDYLVVYDSPFEPCAVVGKLSHELEMVREFRKPYGERVTVWRWRGESGVPEPSAATPG